MPDLLHVLLVAVCGAAGALCRWGVSSLLFRVFGPAFPWGTFVVNVTGCFLIGMLMLLAVKTQAVSPTLRIALGVGFLGGLTTFSSFGYETIALVENEQLLFALANVAMNLLFGLVAVWLGMSLARVLIAGG